MSNPAQKISECPWCYGTGKNVKRHETTVCDHCGGVGKIQGEIPEVKMQFKHPPMSDVSVMMSCVPVIEKDD